MAAAAPSPAPAPTPPAEEFWQKWSPNHEFPLATLGSFAIHVVVVGLFLYYIAKLISFDEKTPVPISPVAVISDDPTGSNGAPGSGGGDREAVENVQTPTDPRPPVPEVSLDQARPVIAEWAPDLAKDPNDILAVTKLPNFDKLSKLNEDLRKQLAKGANSGKGKGNEGGQGDSGQAGKGDGGSGDPNSTGRRTLRWTLQFSTNSGRDYLDQLQAMKATILIPQPPTFRSANVIRDLSRPNKGTPLDDVSSIKEMFFIDDRPDSVAQVAEALELGFVPPQFIAFFPKEIEHELAAKEKAHRNARPEDILSTTFKVIIRDGKPTMTVVDQRLKR